MPRVTVIGTGYLGLTHAVCLADLGHEVLAIDVDAEKIAKAANGEAPFFEPGLEPLLRKNTDSGRLRFTMSFAEIGEFGDIHFLCVGTPEGESGRADLSSVYAAAQALAPHLASPCLIVGKSTVPVGTARQVLKQMRAIAPAGGQVDMAWNPEFLREGFAVQDSLAPDRIVLGVVSDRAEAQLRQVYRAPLAAGTPLLVMDLETAELVKVAANAFLATKISFINAMAEVCEVAGADVTPLAEALGYDARIGRRFLSPGLGYGGGCLPKDIRAFRATAAELGVSSLVSLLGTVDAINLGRRDRVVALARQAAGGSLMSSRVAVLGVAFKPDSDDVRDSPSLAVCDRLVAEGAIVSVHDPVAMPSAAAKRPTLRYAPSVSEAAEGADLVLHLTEWSDYRAIDPAALAAVVARRVIIDARCCLDADLWSKAGWTVHVLGRPAGLGLPRRSGGLDHVGQQHGAGHRADPARHGGQPSGHLRDVRGDVADQPGVVRPGDAHVDHRRAGLDHVRGQQPGPSRGHHHDVRGPGVRGEILGSGVAQRHRGVLGAPGQQQAESPADGDPAPDDGDVGARDGHPVAAQQFDDAARRARQRAGLAEHQLAQVDRVQPVRVLGRVHPVEHGMGVQPGRQRQLDDVPGAGRIGVQFVDHRLHLRLGRVGGQVPPDGRDPDLRAVPVLAVHVGAAAGIVADQDRAEPGHDGTARGQRGHPLRQAGPYFRGHGLAVKHLCGHPSSFRISGKSAGRR